MKIFNTLTKKKEELVTIEPGTIKMYVCGQTVYDYCHLGHARKAVVFDMIRRWFITSGYQVVFVENITDIDDKIIHKAVANNEPISALTKRFIQYMHEDFDRLGIMRPDFQPQATEFIPQMLKLITALVAKDYAYQAANGDVYYRVRKFINYGKLSGKTVDSLRSGERVEIDLYKEDPLDFVLWKHSAEVPYWESPFGRGRPGWHIECSAMAEEILGNNFDIHGGGQDLQFPHHENEIAQSEAHNGCQFANYWLHNGFLNINDEKMSKSLGNFLTLRQLLNEYHPEVLKLLMLKTHYRSPLNFNIHSLTDAKNSLTRIYQALRNYDDENDGDEVDWNNYYARNFKAAMDDDFNTPLALSILFELVTELNKLAHPQLAIILKKLANSIGLLNEISKNFLQAQTNYIDLEDINLLIARRAAAKKTKDFVLADKIREELRIKGIIVEDGEGETIWRKL